MATLMSLLPQRVDAQSRLPGLEGKVTTRYMTIARNSLMVIAGPLSSPMFGQRVSSHVTEGGFGYAHPRLEGSAAGASPDSSLAFMGGVAFGLFETLEAGALFLPLQLAPSFNYGDVPVYITYARRLGAFDIGARLTTYMPTDSQAFRLNPGVPVSWHSENVRIDTALYLPIDFAAATVVGINIPVRISWNIKPKIFVGLETALFDPAFSQAHDTVVPLGAFAGYTMVAGSKLIDIGSFFMWDSFMKLNPASGINTFQPSNYRVLLGLNYKSMVL